MKKSFRETVAFEADGAEKHQEWKTQRASEQILLYDAFFGVRVFVAMPEPMLEHVLDDLGLEDARLAVGRVLLGALIAHLFVWKECDRSIDFRQHGEKRDATLSNKAAYVC